MVENQEEESLLSGNVEEGGSEKEGENKGKESGGGFFSWLWKKFKAFVSAITYPIWGPIKWAYNKVTGSNKDDSSNVDSDYLDTDDLGQESPSVEPEMAPSQAPDVDIPQQPSFGAATKAAMSAAEKAGFKMTAQPVASQMAFDLNNPAFKPFLDLLNGAANRLSEIEEGQSSEIGKGDETVSVSRTKDELSLVDKNNNSLTLPLEDGSQDIGATGNIDELLNNLTGALQIGIEGATVTESSTDDPDQEEPLPAIPDSAEQGGPLPDAPTKGEYVKPVEEPLPATPDSAEQEEPLPAIPDQKEPTRNALVGKYTKSGGGKEGAQAVGPATAKVLAAANEGAGKGGGGRGGDSSEA